MANIVNERDRILNGATVRVLPASGNYIYISAPAQYFRVNNDGTSDQASITFTANLVGFLYGNCTFTVVNGDATLTNIADNQATLLFTDLVSESATIQASLDFQGTTYTAKYTITRLMSGVVGSSAPIVTLTAESDIFILSRDTGEVTPSESLVTATTINVPDPMYTWYIDGVIQSGQNSATLNIPSFIGPNKLIRVEVTSADTPMVFDQFTMASVSEGSSALTITLENENRTISCDSEGTPLTGQFPLSSKVTVLRGSEKLVSGVVYSEVSESGVTSSINATTGVISITSISAITATATYRATVTNYDGTVVTLDKTLSLNKSINGATGLNAAIFSISTSGAIFTKNSAGVINPSGGIVLSTQYQNITGTITYKWQKNGVDIPGATSLSYTVPLADYTSVITNTYKCIVTGTINDVPNNSVSDQITIPLLVDGSSTIQILNSNENITFTGPVSGYSGIIFTGGSSNITAYIGTTQLAYAASGANTFSCTTTSTGATVGSGIGSGTTFAVPAPTALSQDSAFTDITITIRNAAGVASTVTSRITYSLSRAGSNGTNGLTAAIFSISTSGAIFNKTSTGVINPSGGLLISTQYQNITGTITYKWQKNGVDIAGATASSYTIPIADYASVTTNTYKCIITGTVNEVPNTSLNDQITVPLLVDGSSAIQILNSNENITFTGPVSGYSGVIFTGGSSTITAYIGSAQLTYAASGANTFSCTTASTGVTVSSSGSGSTFVVSAPSVMSADSAFTDVTITIRNAAGVASTVTSRITYSLSRAGSSGSNGLNAAIFSISTSGAIFTKNSTGAIIPATGLVLSTQYQNIAGTITYKWQKNDVDISGATSSSYTVPIADYASVSTNTYKCIITGIVNGIANTSLNDQITVPLLVDGSSAIQILNSNENITFSAPNSGYAGIIFTGGSSTITTYIGTTQLTYAASGANTFSCTIASTGVTVTSTGAGSTFGVSAPTAMSADTAFTDVTITIRNGAGVASTVTSRITYSLSRAGLNGSTGVDARSVDLTTTSQSFVYATATGTNPTPASVTVTATARNTLGTVYYEFLVNGSISRAYSTVNTYTYTPAASFDSMPAQVQVNLKEGSGVGPTSGVLATDTLSMFGLRAGSPGTPGVSPIVGFLTNEAATLSADKDGVVSPADLGLAGGSFKVYEGITDRTSLATFSIVSQTGLSVSITATGANAGVYVLNSMSADNGIVTLRAVYGGVTIDRIFNVTKSRVGATGAGAKSLYLSATSQIFQIDKAGASSPAAGITFTAIPGGVLTGAATFTVTSGTATLTGTTNNIRTLTFANMGSDVVTIKAAITDTGVEYFDFITVVKVREGSNAINAILTNENVNLPSDYTGAILSYTGASTEIKIYEGATDVTAQWTISRTNSAGISSTIFSSTVTVTALDADAATITIVATKGTTSITKLFTISKNRGGAPGGTGPRNAQVYFFYNTAAATAPGALLATDVAYDFAAQTASTTKAGWSAIFNPSTIVNTTSSSNKFWAQKVTFQEATFGGTYSEILTPVFTWQNMDGLVTFTNLATNRNSQGINATFIDGGSIITGTLTADKISSGVATLNDPVLPGSFAFGDTAVTILGNTRAVGKFVVNTNNGWAFSAINNYTGSGGEWANGGFFATRAQTGAALGGYSVANQVSTTVTNFRTAFVCGEQNTSLYGICSKESSYLQDLYSTNMNPVHRISDGFLASRTGGMGAIWYGSEDAFYGPSGAVSAKNGCQFGSNDFAGYIFANHTSGQYTGYQRGLMQLYPTWATQFAIHIASPSDGSAFINAGIRSPGGVSPFTGVHELQANTDFELGDILVDKTLLNKSNISNTHYETELSSIREQKTVIGIYAGSMSNSVLSDNDAPEYEEVVNSGEIVSVREIYKPPMKQSWMLENTIQVNAVGEGQINVCGEAGNIEAGDLIVTSSTPGKGMKQTDDIVRNITVAKARESAVFSSPGEIKQIACIYMCG